MKSSAVLWDSQLVSLCAEIRCATPQLTPVEFAPDTILQASSRHKVDGKTRKEWQKVCNAKYWLTFYFPHDG